MAEVVEGVWRGVNRTVAPHLLEQQSPDCLDCAWPDDMRGVLGARPGRTRRGVTALSIRGVVPADFNSGSQTAILTGDGTLDATAGLPDTTPTPVIVSNRWGIAIDKTLTLNVAGAVGEVISGPFALNPTYNLANYQAVLYSWGSQWISNTLAVAPYLALEGLVDGGWTPLIVVELGGLTVFKVTTGTLTQLRVRLYTLASDTGAVEGRLDAEMMLCTGAINREETVP